MSFQIKNSSDCKAQQKSRSTYEGMSSLNLDKNKNKTKNVHEFLEGQNSSYIKGQLLV